MPFRTLGDSHEASLYRNLVKDLPNYAIFRIDLDSVITSWNSGVERILGYNEEQFLGQPFSVLFTPEDREAGIPQTEISQARETGRASDERWHMRRNGTLLFVDGVVTPIVDEMGEVIGFSKVMRDVTERKLAEENQQRLLSQMSELVHALDLTHTIISELDGTIVRWTQGAVALYGWTMEEAYGRKTYDLLQTGFPEPLDDIHAHLLQRGDWQGELTHITKDGHQIHVASHWVLHYDQTQNLMHVIEVNNDVSAMKRIQQELEQANTALSSFAYEVAHDIQAPLRGMATSAELLRRSQRLTLDGAEQDLLKTMVESSSKLGQLVTSLLQYATADTKQEQVEQVSLRALLDEVAAHLGPALAESGAEIDYGALPVISGHPARLLQLFQNLISNAVKYRRTGVRPQIQIAAEREGSGWLIRVKDNGLGIEHCYVEKVFAPLRRLHGPEISGTGLGLAICKRIVESEGGTIWVDSEPGHGSTFCFTLPETERGKGRSSLASTE